MTAALVSIMITIFGAADTACAESGPGPRPLDYADGEAVLQVVEARRLSNWRRYDGTRIDALFKPAQHADGCKGHRGPITLRHVWMGARFTLTGNVGPAWARRAMFYCGGYDQPGLCARRGGKHLGTLRHTFWSHGGKPRPARFAKTGD